MLALSISDPSAGEKLNALFRDRLSEIFCFASSNYYGTQVGNGDALLHKITGIPLAILMHDHPLHFLAQQTPLLHDTITLVPGEDLVDFVTKHYPIRTTAIAWPAGPPVNVPRRPTFEDFLRRENALLCPMNLHFAGATVDTLWQQIKQLPTARRAFSMAHVEAALTDCATPLHVVAERLPDTLLSQDERRDALPDQMLVMNFVKLWRRNAMVRALIELPILISSEYVPADLEASYPGKFRLLTRDQTIPLYREYRFTVNANPTMNLLHDRVLETAASGSVCITDPTPILQSIFHDDMIWFDYTKRNMADVISGYLEDPEAAYRLAVGAQEALLANGDALNGGYRKLIETVKTYWREREPAAI